MASGPGGNSEIGIGKFLEKNPGVPDIAFHRIGQVLQRIILAGRQVNKKVTFLFPRRCAGQLSCIFLLPLFPLRPRLLAAVLRSRLARALQKIHKS